VPLFLSFLISLLLSQHADRPVNAFENTYRDLHTLRVRFLEQYSENGRIVRTEAGIAYFSKPGKMRWEYEKPEKNLFLVDGKNAWFYTPADHTATKIPARQSEDLRTPLALLTEGGKLSKVCERVVPAKLPAIADQEFRSLPGTGLECIMKGDTAKSVPGADRPPASRILLEITAEGELARVVIQSAGSVQTEFRFKDWEYNPSLAEAQFHFSPPPGVVIVDGLLPTSPSVRQK
jgi:outer membrane lipoprotein carrier protein